MVHEDEFSASMLLLPSLILLPFGLVVFEDQSSGTSRIAPVWLRSGPTLMRTCGRERARAKGVA